MIKYHVPLIHQTKQMGCWAASIAMILSWRDNKRYTPQEIAIGCDYNQQREAGLNPEDSTPLKHWGFEWLMPQSLLVAGLYQLLCQRGPLWVASLTPFPHVRVIVGMEPNPDPSKAILYMNDPDPGGAGKYAEDYYVFTIKKDDLASGKLPNYPIATGSIPIYTAFLQSSKHTPVFPYR